jgi:serine/threonine protein kinase
MVKHCFGSDGGFSSPHGLYATKPTPPRIMYQQNQRQQHQHHQLQQFQRPHANTKTPTGQRQQLPHRQYPSHAALDKYHPTPTAPPRKLSPYDRFRQELQLRSAALPFKLSRRERYDSRVSSGSLSSSMAEDELLTMLGRTDLSYGHHQHLQDRRHRSRTPSRRSPVPVPARSYASTAASEDSFSYRSSSGSCRSYGGITPASSTASSARRHHQSSRLSSPSFGFEDLLPECYVLEELIGSGTTSKCYRCRRTTDGRVFACKIINKRRLAFDQAQRDDMAAQLRQEVDVLRRLDHPNIAKLEEAFENETYILLMMELLDGGELFETIIDRVRLSESDAKHTARSLLSAISYMHSQGIVHRDLKPENLLLAARAMPGKPMLVKIVDFGFASSSDATMKSFLGTGGYLAPEVLTHQPYTAAVDTWAFGVLLYLMLCGRVRTLYPYHQHMRLFTLTFSLSVFVPIASLHDGDPVAPGPAALVGVPLNVPRQVLARREPVGQGSAHQIAGRGPVATAHARRGAPASVVPLELSISPSFSSPTGSRTTQSAFYRSFLFIRTATKSLFVPQRIHPVFIPMVVLLRLQRHGRERPRAGHNVLERIGTLVAQLAILFSIRSIGLEPEPPRMEHHARRRVIVRPVGSIANDRESIVQEVEPQLVAPSRERTQQHLGHGFVLVRGMAQHKRQCRRGFPGDGSVVKIGAIANPHAKGIAAGLSDGIIKHVRDRLVRCCGVIGHGVLPL